MERGIGLSILRIRHSRANSGFCEEINDRFIETKNGETRPAYKFDNPKSTNSVYS